MLADNNTQLGLDQSPELRDVTSTARLFNFRRPVYMTTSVWEDCVELQVNDKSGSYDELAILQRLRHVLFMAASALHGRVEDLEYEFRVYRVENTSLQGQRQPTPVNLQLRAHKDEQHRPVITIGFTE